MSTPTSIPDIEVHRHYQLISTTPRYLHSAKVATFLRPKEVGPAFAFPGIGSDSKHENTTTTRKRTKKEPLVKKDTLDSAQALGKGSGTYDNDDDDDENDELDLDLSWAKALDRPLSLNASSISSSTSSSSSPSSSPGKKVPGFSNNPVVGWEKSGRMISNPAELRENLVIPHRDHPVSTATTTTTTPTQTPKSAPVVTKHILPVLTNEDPGKSRSSRKRKRSDSTPPPPLPPTTNPNSSTVIPTSSQLSARGTGHVEGEEDDDDDEIQATQEEMEDMDLAEVGLLGLDSSSVSDEDDEDDDDRVNEEGRDDQSERRGKKSRRVDRLSSGQAEVEGERGEEGDGSVQIKVSRVSMRDAGEPGSLFQSGSQQTSKKSSSKRRSSKRARSPPNVEPTANDNPTQIPLPTSPQTEMVGRPSFRTSTPRKVSTPKAKGPTWATATPGRSPQSPVVITSPGPVPNRAVEVDELETPLSTPVRRGRVGAGESGAAHQPNQMEMTPRRSIRRPTARKAGGGASPKSSADQREGGGTKLGSGLRTELVT